MIVNIKEIESGKTLDFRDSCDLSSLDFYGCRPLTEPVVFEGQIRRHAGLTELTGALCTHMHAVCDRCLTPFTAEKTITVEKQLVLAMQGEERDDIIVCPAGRCDLAELAETEWILEMDGRFLCSGDCRGLCTVCGHNLNHGSCPHNSGVEVVE